MPNLGKGTECIKLLLSQASKDNHEAFVPMFFPVLGAHLSGAEFQYPDSKSRHVHTPGTRTCSLRRQQNSRIEKASNCYDGRLDALL